MTKPKAQAQPVQSAGARSGGHAPRQNQQKQNQTQGRQNGGPTSSDQTGASDQSTKLPFFDDFISTYFPVKDSAHFGPPKGSVAHAAFTEATSIDELCLKLDTLIRGGRCELLAYPPPEPLSIEWAATQNRQPTVFDDEYGCSTIPVPIHNNFPPANLERAKRTLLRTLHQDGYHGTTLMESPFPGLLNISVPYAKRSDLITYIGKQNGPFRNAPFHPRLQACGHYKASHAPKVSHKYFQKLLRLATNDDRYIVLPPNGTKLYIFHPDEKAVSTSFSFYFTNENPGSNSGQPCPFVLDVILALENRSLPLQGCTVIPELRAFALDSGTGRVIDAGDCPAVDYIQPVLLAGQPLTSDELDRPRPWMKAALPPGTHSKPLKVRPIPSVDVKALHPFGVQPGPSGPPPPDSATAPDVGGPPAEAGAPSAPLILAASEPSATRPASPRAMPREAAPARSEAALQGGRVSRPGTPARQGGHSGSASPTLNVGALGTVPPAGAPRAASPVHGGASRSPSPVLHGDAPGAARAASPVQGGASRSPPPAQGDTPGAESPTPAGDAAVSPPPAPAGDAAVSLPPAPACDAADSAPPAHAGRTFGVPVRRRAGLAATAPTVVAPAAAAASCGLTTGAGGVRIPPAEAGSILLASRPFVFKPNFQLLPCSPLIGGSTPPRTPRARPARSNSSPTEVASPKRPVRQLDVMSPPASRALPALPEASGAGVTSANDASDGGSSVDGQSLSSDGSAALARQASPTSAFEPVAPAGVEDVPAAGVEDHLSAQALAEIGQHSPSLEAPPDSTTGAAAFSPDAQPAASRQPSPSELVRV